jgi:hypothetical protein
MPDKQPAAAKDGELPKRAAPARELIRNAGERLTDGDDSPLEFYCECGCWQRVELTITAYDAVGDQPVYRQGHQAAANEASAPIG